MGLWSTKSIAALQADSTSGSNYPTLKRALGPIDLTSLGVGAIVGAGIFIRTGTAAAQYAGPAVVFSFVLAGFGCLLVALCYAEFASMLPVAGSVYTYSYVTFGELVAWIIGWNLILEYLFGAVSVAVSWSGYVVALLGGVGVRIPASLAQAPFTGDWDVHLQRVPGVVMNLPASVLIIVIAVVLATGVRASANLNSVIVAAKVAIILLVVAFGFAYVRMENWHPFIPPSGGSFGRFGWSGVLQGASIVFVAFLGFDAVSTAAEEARDPQRDMPLALVGSLVVCGVLYVLVALVVTGLVRYPQLNAPHPVFVAIESAGPGLRWLTYPIQLAAMAGLFTVALVLLLAQTRIVFAMAGDGLLSSRLGSVHPRARTPVWSTLVVGLVAAVAAGFAPIDLLGDLVVVATLLAFIAISGGVLVLRFRHPNLRRPYRVPLGPVVPGLALVFCAGMLVSFSIDVWIRLAAWTAIGLLIYFSYGARHSLLSRGPLPPSTDRSSRSIS